MDSGLLLRRGLERSIAACHHPAKRRVQWQAHRSLASVVGRSGQDPIRAAPPLRFTNDQNQFGRGRRQSEIIDEFDDGLGGGEGRDAGQHSLLRRVRIVPASPSYFTSAPRFTDHLLHLSALLRKYQTLPMVHAAEAARVAWKTLDQYKIEVAERVGPKAYSMLLQLLRRLNCIHPSLMPPDVTAALNGYKRLVQPQQNQAKPVTVDEDGRARAVGRRKSSHAVVYLVEGDGQCLINGKTLTEYFGRLHDRESALWALKATARLDKYNIWALASGGGTTGQADALTLGVAKALLVHEPDLKPALRRAGCITRDRREVERKKPGKLKARKMPAWVKR